MMLVRQVPFQTIELSAAFAARRFATSPASTADTPSTSSRPPSSQRRARRPSPKGGEGRRSDVSPVGDQGSSSSIEGNDPPSEPGFRVPKTDWVHPLYRDPAPPTFFEQLQPPLPDSAATAAAMSPNIGIGPGASNETSLKHAERALHFSVTKNGGRRFGQPGTRFGVNFRKAMQQSVAMSGEERSESLAQSTRRQRDEAYLENEGGDYSRYLGQTPTGEGAGQEWEKVARQALSNNADLDVHSRQSIVNQVQSILNGTPFGEAPSKKTKKAVESPAQPEAPAPAASGKKKGKK